MNKENISEFLSKEFWANSNREYLVAIFVFLTILLVTQIFKIILEVKVRNWVKKTTTDFDDLILKVVEILNWPVASIVAFNIGMAMLNVDSNISKWMGIITIALLSFFSIRLITNIINYFSQKAVEKLEAEERSADSSVVRLIRLVLNVAVWFLGFILILENVGYDASALLAGVGVSGIAIAFALQNVLSDIFASISIYFDKPFKVGDFIKVDNDSGVVTKVGIKSSRIKTPEGEEIVVPNQSLTQVRIRNYHDVQRRKVGVDFNIDFKTPSHKLRIIPDLIKNIFDKYPEVDFDRTSLKTFGEIGVIFELSFFVNISSYVEYMNLRGKILTDVVEVLEKEKIEMAFIQKNVDTEKI